MKRILLIARALVAQLPAVNFRGNCLHARCERAAFPCGVFVYQFVAPSTIYGAFANITL
jgi:hypothetical protein